MWLSNIAGLPKIVRAPENREIFGIEEASKDFADTPTLRMLTFLHFLNKFHIHSVFVVNFDDFNFDFVADIYNVGHFCDMLFCKF